MRRGRKGREERGEGEEGEKRKKGRGERVLPNPFVRRLMVSRRAPECHVSAAGL